MQRYHVHNPPTKARAAEIRRQCEERARQAAQRFGASAWFEQSHNVLTVDERKAIIKTFNDERNPGTITWVGAFIDWLAAAN